MCKGNRQLRNLNRRDLFSCHVGAQAWFYSLHALNLPTECRKKGITIGDVGIITMHGAFDFLFNICLSHDNPANPSVLPYAFETLSSPEILVQKRLQPEARLASKEANETNDASVTDSLVLRCS